MAVKTISEFQFISDQSSSMVKLAQSLHEVISAVALDLEGVHDVKLHHPAVILLICRV